MATLTSSLVVRLIDQVTAPARNISRALLGIEDATKGGLGARLGAALERNNAALDATRGRLLDAVGGLYVLKKGFDATVRPAASFESAMADVAKVSGFDDKGLDLYGKRLRKLATTEIPLAVTDLAALSAAAAQAGVADEELFDFTRLTAKAAVAWEVTGAQAGEALAKIKTALNLTTSQAALFADAINHLSDNTASSAPDLVDFSKRVAAQGEFFGFAKEETLAFGAAMISAGAQSEVAATSFRNMGRALTKGASATKAQRSAYRRLGLDANKVAKAMQKDAVGTTLTVIERLGKLPEHMQASVMSDLFGDEARALAPLLGRLDILRNALRQVADEQDYANSVGREFEKRAQTAEYAWQRFKSQLGDIGLVIGGTLLPAMKDLMAVLGPVALKIAEFAEAHPALVKGVVLATTALVGFRIAAIGGQWAALMARGALLQAALAFTRFGAGVRVAALLAAGPLVRAGTAVAGVMQTIALRNALATRALGRSPGVLARASDAFLVLGRSLGGLLNPMNLVRGAVLALRAALIGSGIGAAVLGLAAAGTWIYNNWSGIQELFAGIWDGFVRGLGPATAALQPAADLIKQLYGWVSGLFGSVASLVGPVAESNKEWRAWGETIGGVVAQGINAIAAGLSRAIGFFKDAYDWAVRLGSAIGSWAGGMTSDKLVAPSGSNFALGGARAQGGPVRAGETYLVGEEGPELFRPNRSGSIVPSAETMRMLRNSGAAGASRSAAPSGGGRPISMTNHFVISGVSDPAEVARQAARRLGDELRFALRGAEADLGIV